MGYAGFRGQRSPSKAAEALRQSDRLVPFASLGSLARPPVLVEPAGGKERARAGGRRALSRERPGRSGRSRLRRARDADPRVDREARDRPSQPVGSPRPRAEEEAEEARWRDAVTPFAFVHTVLSLDAFARCWVQEITLLRAVARALPEEKRAVFARLEAAWQVRRMAEFDASVEALAGELTRAACDREPLDDASFTARLREVGKAIGIARAAAETSKDRAMRALAERLDSDIRITTDRLIAIHGLEGMRLPKCSRGWPVASMYKSA